MPPTPVQVTLPARGLAALSGTVVGLLTFAATAALWRAGRTGAAELFSEGVLLAALAAMAAVTLLAQPARMRRARVPVGRALPHAWWPPHDDALPALAMCAGAPVAAGATAALLLFR